MRHRYPKVLTPATGRSVEAGIAINKALKQKKTERAEPLTKVTKAAKVCPVHGIPDCSPLLNGCTWKPEGAK